MSECSTCSQYLSPEDMIRSSVRCSANGSVSILGALLNQTPPDSDLLLKFDSRVGNVLSDSVSAETATVFVEEFKSNGTTTAFGDKTRVDEHIFDGNNYTIYFRFKQHTAAPTTGSQSILQIGSSSTILRGINITNKASYARVNLCDGTTNYETSGYTPTGTNTDFLLVDYVDCIITIDGTNKVAVVGFYNPAGSLIGAQKTQSLAAFTFNTNDNGISYLFNSSYFIITNFKKFEAIKTLAQCLNNSYITDLQIHYPHVVGLMDVSGNNNYLTLASGPITQTHIAYINFNSYALDYGWDDYIQYLSGYTVGTPWNIYIPRKPDGSAVTYDVTIGGAPYAAMRIYGERVGGGVYNCFPAKIRFTNAFFDRSNATIWNDSARLGYYDSGNVKDFHVSELNQRTLMSWLNDGYRGRLYIHFNGNSIEKLDRDFLLGIRLYTTDYKGSENKALLNLTGDIFAAVLSGSTVTYDADGYVKLGYFKATKPMLSLRIDDGFADAYTGWRGFFATNNISPVLGIILNLIDTATFLTWDQVRTLVSEGWIMSNHGNDDTDYSTALNQATLETMLIDGKAGTEAQGVPCNYYTGQRHSSSNPAIEYLAHKVGFKSHLAWSNYGEQGIRGTNPENINKFRMCAIDIDLGLDWNVEALDASTEIAAVKLELDKCQDNRLAIMFVHKYGVNLANNLQTLINYAIAEGIEIVSIDEALDNCKYL